MVKFKIKLTPRFEKGRYQFSKVKFGTASDWGEKHPGEYGFFYNSKKNKYKLDLGNELLSDEKSDKDWITEEWLERNLECNFWVLVD